jgi:hypothetical protein
MSKRLILILALALTIGLSLYAYAEVQNVKVSGDITVSGVARNNFDLAKTPTNSGAGFTASNLDDKQTDILSILRLRVDADLTDNVGVTAVLLNERNWNGEASADRNNYNVAAGGLVANAASERQVTLTQAYVSLKEFLYSPLSLKVGRQPLRFGNGWVVGDPDTNLISARSNLAEGDLSVQKSFDALRATLDYSPLVVDAVYAKIEENNVLRNDDTTLYGVNAAYEVDKNTTLEAFFFSKEKGSNAAAVNNIHSGNATSFVNANPKPDKVHTVGGRIVNKTIKNLAIDAQAAYQFGNYNPKFDVNAWDNGTGNRARSARRSAWGLEVGASYDLKEFEPLARYNPVVSGAFVYLSGENSDRLTGEYNAWDAMYEDQTFGHIINAIMGFSNVKLGGASIQATPMEDVTARVDYVVAWLAKKFTEGRIASLSGVNGSRTFRMGDKAYLGQEIDLTLTYDYTEDVQFSLLGGVFLPGKINDGVNIATGTNTTGNKVAATELIGSMKVTF